MAHILLNGAEPFEQIVNIFSTEGPMWNLVKTVQAVSKKKSKDFTISYMYIYPKGSSSSFNSIGSLSLENISKIWILNIFPV